MTLRMRLLFTLLPVVLVFVGALAWLHSQAFEATKAETRLFLFIVTTIALFLVTALVILVARQISKPIESLKNAALEIAAGDYGHPISVKGTREVVELANVLNTMRECLHDYISRWRDHSHMLERRYGEYECAILLQHHMLQKVVDDFLHQRLKISLIRGGAVRSAHGAFLRFQEEENALHFTLQEAIEPGFLETYTLLLDANQEKESCSSISLHFDLEKSVFTFQNQGMPAPLFWSKQQQIFVSLEKNKQPLQEGDLIFLRNKGFFQLFATDERAKENLSRILRHFGNEEIDAWQRILSNELTFLSSRQRLDQGLFLLCFAYKKV